MSHEDVTKLHVIISERRGHHGWTTRESACGRYGMDVCQWSGGSMTLKDGSPVGYVCLTCAKAVARSVTKMVTALAARGGDHA